MDLNQPTSDFLGEVIKRREVSGLMLLDGKYPATSSVTSHSHETALFCMPLDGTCEERYRRTMRSYEPFTVNFLPAYHDHTLIFSHGQMRAFTLHVSEGWLDRTREYSPVLDKPLHGNRGLSGLFLKVYQEFLMPDTASALAIEGLALEMLATASRQIVKGVNAMPPRWLSQATEVLTARFNERITVSQLAAQAGVHPVYLAREFRRYNRCTIGEYVRRLRIEQSCRELSVLGESLAIVAARAGFADQSHFSRTFKRMIGMTPSEYRSIRALL